MVGQPKRPPARHAQNERANPPSEHPYLEPLPDPSPPSPQAADRRPRISDEEFERRLATDPEFAARYNALQNLALSGPVGPELEKLAREIVRDDPVLAARLDDSDAVARELAGKPRFLEQIQFGILRFLRGKYRGYPTAIPQKRSPRDRILRQLDTLEWRVFEADPDSPTFRPIEKWLTKQGVAALLELHESTVDDLMRKDFLKRIPPKKAPDTSFACFWTKVVMRVRRIELKMRLYRDPKP